MTAQPASTATLLQALQWRYATKKFDPARKISDSDWAALEEVLLLTPTSYGMQPFRIIEVAQPETRAALLPHSWNQRQVVDASHFVVLAGRLTVTEADIDRYMTRISEVRGTPAAALGGFRGMLVGDVINGARGAIVRQWAAHQAYIALGNLMTSAALLGIDTCPMEGFEPAKYDELLGLTELGLGAVVACALGYRAADDASAGYAKVRLPRAEMLLKR